MDPGIAQPLSVAATAWTKHDARTQQEVGPRERHPPNRSDKNHGCPGRPRRPDRPTGASRRAAARARGRSAKTGKDTRVSDARSATPLRGRLPHSSGSGDLRHRTVPNRGYRAGGAAEARISDPRHTGSAKLQHPPLGDPVAARPALSKAHRPQGHRRRFRRQTRKDPANVCIIAHADPRDAHGWRDRRGPGAGAESLRRKRPSHTARPRRHDPTGVHEANDSSRSPASRRDSVHASLCLAARQA